MVASPGHEELRVAGQGVGVQRGRCDEQRAHVHGGAQLEGLDVPKPPAQIRLQQRRDIERQDAPAAGQPGDWELQACTA